MTEEQRRLALTLCDRILETAAKLQADLAEAKDVIAECRMKRSCAESDNRPTHNLLVGQVLDR